MIQLNELTPTEIMVAEGRKPGAHGIPGQGLSKSETLYDSLGIDSVNYKAHGMKKRSIGSFALVADIWNDFETAPHLNNYAPHITQLLKEIGSRSIAEAVAFLDTYPRPRSGNPHNLELPQVAILEGALFGYHTECVDYYIATRYEGEPEDPLALEALQFMNHHAPDMHIPSPSCPSIAEAK